MRTFGLIFGFIFGCVFTATILVYRRWRDIASLVKIRLNKHMDPASKRDSINDSEENEIEEVSSKGDDLEAVRSDQAEDILEDEDSTDIQPETPSSLEKDLSLKEDLSNTPSFEEESSAEHSLDDLTEGPDVEELPPSSETSNGRIPHLSESNTKDYFFDKPKKSGKGSVLHLVILMLIGIGVIGIAVYLLKGGTFNFPSGSKPTPIPTSSNRPSPGDTLQMRTPLERSKYVVRILNGSGKTGLAASVSARLKDQGYQIEKTGNAGSDTQRTTIEVKKGLESLLEQLVTDLSGGFDATGSATLPDSEVVDAEVILGIK